MLFPLSVSVCSGCVGVFRPCVLQQLRPERTVVKVPISVFSPGSTAHPPRLPPKPYKLQIAQVCAYKREDFKVTNSTS